MFFFFYSLKVFVFVASAKVCECERGVMGKLKVFFKCNLEQCLCPAKFFFFLLLFFFFM